MIDSITRSEALDMLQPAPEGESWVVLHAKPRCEKKVVALQKQRPAKMFLPTLERVHTYGARHRVNHVPMFPGYVFACIRSEDQRWFRQNNQVANLIRVQQEDRFLQPLRAVAQALASGVELNVLPFVKPGQNVRITGGPMKGLEAEITEVDGEKTVVLTLELIQQSVSMRIDISYLKAIG